MASKDPAFLFYSNDWISGTSDMMPIEKGIYIDLLAFQHQKGILPNDTTRLAHLVRMSHNEFLKHWKFLSTKFESNGEGLVNRKLLSVMDERQEKGKKNRISGTFATCLRQLSLSSDQSKYLKENFNIIDFYEVNAENLKERITEWITERLSERMPLWSESIEDVDVNEDNVLKLWVRTFGKNPKLPEVEETEKLISKFGYQKTYEIFKQATLSGFRNLGTLINSLDESGNIKPKVGIDRNNGKNENENLKYDDKIIK